MCGLTLMFLILPTYTAFGAANCESKRPRGESIQSGVCCNAPWEVTQSKADAMNSIVDIDKLIFEFTTKDPDSRLMIDVTNFRRVDLHNSRNPVLLRWPLPAYKKE